MYHSITIGKNLLSEDGSPKDSRNTWSDWHLIPTSRPLVNPPNPKLSLIEIPGADGALDLTEAITGRPTYNDRGGSWSFYAENGFKEWSDLYSEIMDYLHGKKLQAILEDDPSYYYEGRFSVNQWRSDAARSMIVINYEVGPYKRYSMIDGDNWLWDPFNFESGIIKSYRNMVVKTGVPLVLDVEGGAVDTIPVITSGSSGVILNFEGVNYSINQGVNVIDSVAIKAGNNNRLTFTYSNGSTTITLKITGGRL